MPHGIDVVTLREVGGKCEALNAQNRTTVQNFRLYDRTDTPDKQCKQYTRIKKRIDLRSSHCICIKLWSGGSLPIGGKTPPIVNHRSHPIQLQET